VMLGHSIERDSKYRRAIDTEHREY